MKGLDRRAFLREIGVTAAAAAAPGAWATSALPSPRLCRGPVEMKLLWLFGPTSFRVNLFSNPSRNRFFLHLKLDDRHYTLLGLPLAEFQQAVARRGSVCLRASRLPVGKPGESDSLVVLVQAQRRWGNVVRLLDADEALRESRPSVGILQLKDVQAVLPKA